NIISFRTQVVVDDVEYHRHTAPVACVDQPLEPLRPTIAVLYGEGVDAVVSPVTIPGKLRYRHQFNRGHSQRPESLEVTPHGLKGSLMGKSADVKLVKDIIFERRGLPGGIRPFKPCTIDHLRRSVDPLRLETRRGVRVFLLFIETVQISSPWRNVRKIRGIVAPLLALEFRQPVYG